jgi:hypothetical protein
MLLVLADHTHHPAAVDDLALVTNLLYRCPNLHEKPQFSVVSYQFSAISYQGVPADY